MAIDFRLTTEQQELREAARDFAQNVLAPLVPDADAQGGVVALRCETEQEARIYARGASGN